MIIIQTRFFFHAQLLQQIFVNMVKQQYFDMSKLDVSSHYEQYNKLAPNVDLYYLKCPELTVNLKKMKLSFKLNKTNHHKPAVFN